MAAVSTVASSDGLSIEFSWTEPKTRGSIITAYEVQIYSKILAAYVKSLTLCDYSNLAVKTCSITQATLRSSLGYSAGDLPLANARAQNTKGWSSYSTANILGQVVQSTPLAPNITSLINNADPTKVNIVWTSLTTPILYGYSSVTGYKVYSNGGSGDVFTTLVASTAAGITSAEISGLTSGNSYSFRVLASNIFGDGKLSPAMSIISASAPSQMSPIVISTSNLNVKLSWSLPTTNGYPISSYQILLYNPSLTPSPYYAEVKSLCDGSNLQVRQAQSCSIPMSSFISSLGYSAGQQIQARAIATNQLGSSTQSIDSTSVILVQTVPSSPQNPTLTVISQTSMQVSWDALTTSASLGYASTLTSYNLYWDAGLGGNHVLYSQTSLNTATLSNLQTGSTYSFYITGTNMYGEGSKSTTVNL
jgi:hypothetical protein